MNRGVGICANLSDARYLFIPPPEKETYQALWCERQCDTHNNCTAITIAYGKRVCYLWLGRKVDCFPEIVKNDDSGIATYVKCK